MADSAFGFRVGDRVRHTCAGNMGMGLGTVTSVADGDVVVQFDRRGMFGRCSTGIYGEHWFRSSRATLTHEAPETGRSTPAPAPISGHTVAPNPEIAEAIPSLKKDTASATFTQGIEARQGGNGEAGAVHESPVGEADAPDTSAGAA